MSIVLRPDKKVLEPDRKFGYHYDEYMMGNIMGERYRELYEEYKEELVPYYERLHQTQGNDINAVYDLGNHIEDIENRIFSIVEQEEKVWVRDYNRLIKSNNVDSDKLMEMKERFHKLYNGDIETTANPGDARFYVSEVWMVDDSFSQAMWLEGIIVGRVVDGYPRQDKIYDYSGYTFRNTFYYNDLETCLEKRNDGFPKVLDMESLKDVDLRTVSSLVGVDVRAIDEYNRKLVDAQRMADDKGFTKDDNVLDNYQLK